jgi:hypothetical protein
MAETIDSLLVSLGLETDAKSFQKANDAIKGVKDGVLQLAAAAGVGLGFKALTSDLAKSTVEMSRLSKITDFTIKQIGGLRFAMLALRQDPNAANAIVQKIPDLQQRAKQGELGTKAYWNGSFNPTEFAEKSGMDALKYLVDAYGKMNNDQRRTLRNGIGAGDNDPLTRLMELGSKGLGDILKDFEQVYKPLDPKLIESSIKFNKEMAALTTNFDNLSQSLGGKLLPVVNGVLESINKFILQNPGVSEALLTAAGVGGTGAALGMAKKILPGSKTPKPSGGGGYLSKAWSLLGGYAIAASGVESYERIQAMLEGREYGGIQSGKGEFSELERLKALNTIENSKRGSTPRGIRNNNPGNLNYAGQAGASLEDGSNARFAKFESMEQGISALHRQIGLYLGRGKNTLSDIVNTYAPASDNNNVQAYVSALSKATGLGAYDKISADDNETLVKLVKGIIDHENGAGYVSIADVAGGVNSGPDLSSYQYLASTPPNQPGRSGAGSGMAMTQNNNVTINAPGADAGEIDNRLANAFTDYSRQARDMMDTEHF